MQNSSSLFSMPHDTQARIDMLMRHTHQSMMGSYYLSETPQGEFEPDEVNEPRWNLPSNSTRHEGK